MVLGDACLGKQGRLISAVMAAILLAGCANDGGNSGRRLDWDLRNNDSSTAGAVEQATNARPAPDGNGVISYPGYQVIVARRGDTVTTLAQRVGLSGAQLAAYNALKPDDSLRAGEVLALPVRVGAQATATAAPTASPAATSDVTSIASAALDSVETSTLPSSGGTAASKPAATTPFSAQSSGPVPVRYQVKRGETAFTIARQFNISAKALADWNGLGADLSVREGQFLIIPTPQDAARLPSAPVADATPPGQGSPLPEPPSAKTPLPDEPTPTAAEVAKTVPASPDLGASRTTSSAAQFAMPVDGKVVRGYQKKVNDGIDIAATAGAPVKAATAGVVAAVTKDPSGAPILVLKHSGGLLTVYTGIDGITVAQGATVTRGQTIAKVAPGNSPQVHFEVRQGLESVDPLPYL